MVVTFLLDFAAARRGNFAPRDASALNRMVLVYAVPLALFAGTVTTSRGELSQVIPLVIALCVAIIGLYGVPQAHFIRADMTTVERPLCAFDAVSAFSSITHVPRMAVAGVYTQNRLLLMLAQENTRCFGPTMRASSSRSRCSSRRALKAMPPMVRSRRSIANFPIRSPRPGTPTACAKGAAAA
jgi:hypothetical protein